MITDHVDLQDEVVFKLWAKSLSDYLNIEDNYTPTLLNSWANDTGRTTKYYKHLNRVYIEGKLVSGTGVAFVLPEGYRPDETLTFTNLTIDTSGNVNLSAATSLDGISFRI